MSGCGSFSIASKGEAMKSKIIGVILLLTAGLASAAHADPTPFKVGAVGTRYYLASGGYVEIAKIDGQSVTTVNSAGQSFSWIGLFLGISSPATYQFRKSEIESIWPLEIGKKVQFDFSGSGATSMSTGTWTNEFRVLRAEKVKVEAGEFDTIVVQWYDRGIQGAGLGFIGTTTYWYAPQAGFFVKRVFEQQTGGANRVSTFEVTRIVPPK
jgi:hypothetical protein